MKQKERVKPLATLSDEDRLTYARAHALFLQKQTEFAAAANYLDTTNTMLQAMYDLPEKFDIDLQTGKVMARA